MHIPESFDVQKPGVIVVFFHGNGATLERDVRDRQLVPQQITDSGVNAVLLAPQMAVDAADSSAGKFWQPGGFKRFMDESVGNLASSMAIPPAPRPSEKMPIVIVGYSGGFLPTAWSLEVGGISDRVRGVILLDAVYGELDKFATWIENHSQRLLRLVLHPLHRPRDRELMSMLRGKGIAVREDMDSPLRRAAWSSSRPAKASPSRLRHPGMDQKSDRAGAGEDGRTVDAGRDGHDELLEPLARALSFFCRFRPRAALRSHSDENVMLMAAPIPSPRDCSHLQRVLRCGRWGIQPPGWDLQEGLYKVEFYTVHGTGTGVIYAHSGSFAAANSAFAFVGSYRDEGDGINVKVSTSAITPIRRSVPCSAPTGSR